MGNSQIVKQEKKHDKFGKVLLPSQTHINQMYILKDIISKSMDLGTWQSLKNHQSHIYQPSSFIYNVDLLSTNNNGVCNDSCTACLQGERYEATIYEQIQKRKKINNYYTHQEIWYLLYVIFKVSVFVHRHGPKCFIGNVHPRNILINDDGLIKIVTKNSLPYQLDHYQMYCRQGISHAFISPQLLGFYMKRNHTALEKWQKKSDFDTFPPCVDKQESQIFTIGMTILALCTLNNDLSSIFDTTYFFNYPSKSNSQHKIRQISHSTKSQRNSKIKRDYHDYQDLLNHNNIHNLIVEVKQRYCGLLGIIIEDMINANPKARLHIEELYDQLLKKNEEEIFNMNMSWLGKFQTAGLTQSSIRQVNNEDDDDQFVTPVNYKARK